MPAVSRATGAMISQSVFNPKQGDEARLVHRGRQRKGLDAVRVTAYDAG